MLFDLPQIIEQMAAHLHVPSDQIELAPIQHGTLERNNVWRLTAMGHSYLLKQHLITRTAGASTFTPFQVESSILSTLHQRGCCVPRIHWQSESAQCLLLEWCGDTTLDDLAQETSTEGLKLITRNTLRAFCKLEQGFAKCVHRLEPYIYLLDHSDFLHRTMRELLNRGRKTMGYLASLSGQPMRSNTEAVIDSVWTRISNRLHNVTPTLGRLDYNARNVVVDGTTPAFIDFASIGWDWGERRLVQSLNSIGANRPGGNFISLLDQGIVEEYTRQIAEHRSVAICHWKELAAQIDYHHLLFYLSIVYRLIRATAQPEAGQSRFLMKAWGDAKARFRQAIELFVDTRLSDDADAAQIREFVAEFRGDAEQRG